MNDFCGRFPSERRAAGADLLVQTVGCFRFEFRKQFNRWLFDKRVFGIFGFHKELFCVQYFRLLDQYADDLVTFVADLAKESYPLTK